MLDVKKCLKLKNVAVFAGGVLFGTAGVKVLEARTLRSYTSTASQQVSAQKSAL